MKTDIFQQSTSEPTSEQLTVAKNKWESFNTSLDRAQIDYITGRAIDFEKIKWIIRNNNGKVAMSVKNEKGQVINVQSRRIDANAEKRFELIGGLPSKGLFFDGINHEKKEVIVVEWLFDFLSLRQYDTNIVGIVSATNGLDKIKAFHDKGYVVTFVPDTDEPGKQTIEKMKELLPEFYLFDLADSECKDINEYLIKSTVWDEVLNIVRELRQYIKSDIYIPKKTEEYKHTKKDNEDEEFHRSFKHIWYDESLEKGYTELNNTSIHNVISWWWQEFDEKLGYLMGGRLYLIGGSTWTGKSTFLNQVAYNVTKQWFRVVRYSLEDRLEERRKEEIYYMIGRIRKEKGMDNYLFYEFEANNVHSESFQVELIEAKKRLKEDYKNMIDLEKNKRMRIEDLAKLIEEEVKKGCKLFIIDHLHYFNMSDGKDKWRKDLIIESVMQEINEIARRYCIIIMLIAHYRKLEKNIRPTNNDFKDSIATAQICNKIIHIYRDMNTNEWKEESTTEFIIGKSRGPWGEWTILAEFNRATFEYKFLPSKLQVQREQWKKEELDF